MIELSKNVQAGAPDTGSVNSVKAQRLQSVSQTQKEINKKVFNNAAEKVNAEKEQKKKVEEVENAVKVLNESLKSLDIKREFMVDKELGRVVVRLIDKENGDTIKQLPTEEALKLARNIKEMVGLMLDERF